MACALRDCAEMAVSAASAHAVGPAPGETWLWRAIRLLRTCPRRSPASRTYFLRLLLTCSDTRLISWWLWLRDTTCRYAVHLHIRASAYHAVRSSLRCSAEQISRSRRAEKRKKGQAVSGTPPRAVPDVRDESDRTRQLPVTPPAPLVPSHRIGDERRDEICKLRLRSSCRRTDHRHADKSPKSTAAITRPRKKKKLSLAYSAGGGAAMISIRAPPITFPIRRPDLR